ncbi:MAG: hypothetical protein ACPGWR_04785 [Ardenticatenaceae bacterium]
MSMPKHALFAFSSSSAEKKQQPTPPKRPQGFIPWGLFDRLTLSSHSPSHSRDRMIV